MVNPLDRPGRNQPLTTPMLRCQKGHRPFAALLRRVRWVFIVRDDVTQDADSSGRILHPGADISRRDHAEHAEAGCRVRICLGDADSQNVQLRGQEERFGHGIESRCRLALLHYRSLVDVAGVEIRTHGTTLYNSIYRADDQALINAHVWGVNAYGAPVWHLRRAEGGSMFDTYAGSFDASGPRHRRSASGTHRVLR
ncbi:hypothetical protein ABZ667_06235 [Streptomyces lavendulae]|uniref:hypothetical protein n=1 Tax=Streptomyces lavendulae TaxID=1914 RepID=UPI0033D6E8D2